MSIFSQNEEPTVVPAETVEDHYADVADEDYTTAEEPDFGDDA